MLYAKIVLPLPVEGPFDYSVPDEYRGNIAAGMRAWVNFRGKKELGFVVAVSPDTDFPVIKPILKLVDNAPVLDPYMLKLTRMLADYYCCSWGEAIGASLPQPLRAGRPVDGLVRKDPLKAKEPPENLAVLDLDGKGRWELYAEQIRSTLAEGRSVIVLVPDKSLVAKARELIALKTGSETESSFRQQPNELEEWRKIHNGEVRVVVGTRSSVFAPLSDLGLVIIDEEYDPVYKQDQSPHYHSRQAALQRGAIQNARVILGGGAVSLESYYLAGSGKIGLRTIARSAPYPEIKLIDMKSLPMLNRKKNVILSRLLQDAMIAALASGGKILLFLNRKGFATSAICSTCGKPLKCPRCNTNLVYFFDGNILRCHYCNYKLVPPKICPQCNSGYIKFSGAGTEKIESELSRIFPQARVKRIDAGQAVAQDEADIFIATQGIIRQAESGFALVALLGIDNSLNHVDFRSSEKAFFVLLGLLSLTREKMMIQTSLPGHYCFRALEKNDPTLFYEEELRSRQQVKFPPYRNFCQVRVRGRSEEKVAGACEKIFQKLSAVKPPEGIELISSNPGQPPKLRGNYYQVILLAAVDVLSMTGFLKNSLKDFRQSGIIVTVDVDPV